MNPIVKLNHRLAAIAAALQSPFLLVIRLFWGWQFFETGKGKLSDISRPTQFFTHLHIPSPHLCAIIVSLTEFIGGPLLFLGLATRFITPILVFEMSVAYITSEQEALRAFFSNPDKFLAADPFLFLYASLIVFVFGPGRISIDALLFKRTASDTPPGA
jgi:putative oxidoreductase